ncbi:MAG TPA: DNA repair protein RecO [Nevskia sp.]|nr:DNA repair protein RecO [Nevskia sp.]
MRQRIEFEPAWLLAQRPYRESSQLLEIFTREHGRVGLVARGARGPRSKLRGVVQLFTPLLLSWSEAGELGTLIAAEAAGPAVELAGERVFHGWYLNELLLKLTERHDPHPGLYGDYGAALGRLPGPEGEAALRIFEKHLLAEMGYALPLPDALEPGRRYRFDPERGAYPAGASDQDSYAAASLLALQEERLETREALREARKLLRAALRHQLGGRELETPRLLRELRARIPNLEADD